MKDYIKIDFWGINKDIAVKLTGLSIVAFFVFFWFFNSIYLWVSGGTEYRGSISENIFINFAFWMILYFATLVIHEFFHGLTMRIFGGRPKYGAALAGKVIPVFYCTEKDGITFSRRQFIYIALAPLLGISFLGVLIMITLPFLGPFVVLCLVANSSGAIGDLWMVSVLRKYPRHILIVDKKDGIEVYGKDGDQSLNIPVSGFVNIWLKGFLVSLPIFIFIIMFLPLVIGGIFGVDSFRIGPKDSFFTIVDYRSVADGNGFETSAGFLPAPFFSALIGLVYTILKTTKQK